MTGTLQAHGSGLRLLSRHHGAFVPSPPPCHSCFPEVGSMFYQSPVPLLQQPESAVGPSVLKLGPFPGLSHMPTTTASEVIKRCIWELAGLSGSTRVSS